MEANRTWGCAVIPRRNSRRDPGRLEFLAARDPLGEPAARALGGASGVGVSALRRSNPCLRQRPGIELAGAERPLPAMRRNYFTAVCGGRTVDRVIVFRLLRTFRLDARDTEVLGARLSAGWVNFY